jgi:hypothetical protein
MQHRTSLPILAALAAFAFAGCATHAPPAERTIYVIREMPMVLASQGPGPTAVVPQDASNDPEAEAARRAWIEQEYWRPRIQVAEQSAEDGRYVPEKQLPQERVIVVEREPSRIWFPPISLSLGYSGGHGGHHHGGDGWGWGVGWGFPLWGW